MSEPLIKELGDVLAKLGVEDVQDVERVLAWHVARYERLGGLAEVAALCNRSRPAVSNWIREEGKNTPAPVRRLEATPLWDLEEWRAWGREHPHLMGPAFNPVGPAQLRRRRAPAKRGS